MFSIKRNQVVVTALAVMVAVAGFINFTENKSSGKISSINLEDATDCEALLNDDGTIATMTDDENDGIELALGEEEEYDDTGAAIFVNATPDTYFVQAKLDREQSRAVRKDMLTEMINNSNINEDKKQECADDLLEIQQRIEKESAAEAMIKSKGFGDVYVRIDDETVDVVVNKGELTKSDLAQIMDIVSRKTGMKDSQIRISPLKTGGKTNTAK